MILKRNLTYNNIKNNTRNYKICELVYIEKQNTYDIKSKRISILDTYGENFIKKEFITNPAIGREKELKELIRILAITKNSQRIRNSGGFFIPFWQGGLIPRLATFCYLNPTICKYSS